MVFRSPQSINYERSDGDVEEERSEVDVEAP
jgi:hypothetical protein